MWPDCRAPWFCYLDIMRAWLRPCSGFRQQSSAEACANTGLARNPSNAAAGMIAEMVLSIRPEHGRSTSSLHQQIFCNELTWHRVDRFDCSMGPCLPRRQGCLRITRHQKSAIVQACRVAGARGPAEMCAAPSCAAQARRPRGAAQALAGLPSGINVCGAVFETSDPSGS